MNARFRIGKTYKFKVIQKVFISDEPLVYMGYSGTGYKFKGDTLSGQFCPKNWIENGYVSVKTEQDKN